MVNFQELWERAQTKGSEALTACIPTPMTVIETDLSGNQIPDSEEYFVEGGECGFAWVTIKPGNCPFANWLKKNGFAEKDSYYGGVSIWIHEGGQSVTRKKAFAEALAKVFEENGIKAYAMSRLD